MQSGTSDLACACLSFLCVVGPALGLVRSSVLGSQVPNVSAESTAQAQQMAAGLLAAPSFLLPVHTSLATVQSQRANSLGRMR